MLEKQGYGRSACDWQECMLPWHHERKEKSELLDNYRYQLKTRSKMMWQRVTKQTLMTQSCERKRNGKSSTITRHDTKSKLHLCPNCVDIFSDFLIFHGVSHNHVKIHQSSDFSDVLITQALRRPQNKRRRKKKTQKWFLVCGDSHKQGTKITGRNRTCDLLGSSGPRQSERPRAQT